MQDYVSLAIVGVLVSTFVQFVKSSGFPYPRLLVAAASIGAAVGYHFIGGTPAWQAGLQVLVWANAVYAFIIAKFE